MKFKVFKSNYIFAARNENQIKEISDDEETRRRVWVPKCLVHDRPQDFSIVEQSVAS